MLTPLCLLHKSLSRIVVDSKGGIIVCMIYDGRPFSVSVASFSEYEKYAVIKTVFEKGQGRCLKRVVNKNGECKNGTLKGSTVEVASYIHRDANAVVKAFRTTG